jgi:RNA polymerase sigma-70 factor (ECF subfamily)
MLVCDAVILRQNGDGMATDEQLMARAGRGDMDAFEALVRRHQNTAVGVAWRYLGDRSRAEDVAQEAFLKILDAAPSYEPTAKFTTYLYNVVWRLCIDRYRKKAALQWDPSIPHQADADPPDARMQRRETAERVRRALSALPPRQRMALVLQHYEEMSYAEIAEALECSPSAVGALLTRARDALRALLEDAT